MPNAPVSSTVTFLDLSDVSTSPPTLVKSWDSDSGPLHLGRAPKDRLKEAQDPRGPLFRSDKTKVMSSVHATIEWKNGAPHLSDCHSTNGTFVNDRQLRPGQPYKVR